ncbi:YbaK/EbsC family protein [Stackebrandtia albiflava]
MLAAAASRGVDVTVRARPAARTLEEAATILGVTPADIAKTLVVRRAEADYLFAVVPGDRAVSWPRLRRAVGVNRLSLPDADEAREATGYARGTITPIGSHTAWPVFIDDRLTGRTVAMGAGAHGYSAFVAIDALAAGYGATVTALT